MSVHAQRQWSREAITESQQTSPKNHKTKTSGDHHNVEQESKSQRTKINVC